MKKGEAMPYVNRARFVVDATPEQAFALISDLTRSPEWATNPLAVERVGNGPNGVGAKYHSKAKFMGKDVEADQEVTAFDPPGHFAFINTEHNERYTHDFTVRTEGGKTVIERSIVFEVPGFRGFAIRFVVPFLSKKFDKAATEKLTQVFPPKGA
jgi:ligand-binding SRPBCC domain-containing protein